MYKLLLCCRYLRTRYIALASIISVTLGVATMIVVNSVMSGFAHAMQDQLQGILSDLVFEAHGFEGFPDFEWHAARILEAAGDDIAAMTPTVRIPAILNYQVNGRMVYRQVNFIGIEPESFLKVSDCREFLQHPENRKHLTFQLRDGYDQQDHLSGDHDPERRGLADAGWPHRQRVAERERAMMLLRQPPRPIAPEVRGAPRSKGGADADDDAVDPFARVTVPRRAAADDHGVDPSEEPNPEFDKAREQFPGVVLGYGLASFRGRDGADYFLTIPGDDVQLTFPTAGLPPKVVSATFTVVDFYQSKMSEYDSACVFVPIQTAQQMRGMVDPQSGAACITSIQIKLKPGADLNAVRDKLRAAFPPEVYAVSSWRDSQRQLLEAVQMETAILNLLLFLIIAVAGFGILAIFFMIVVEKTRDIGVLKSLGASGGGVLSIFLTYGMSLGIVGSGAGLAIGLLIVRYIDQLRHLIERLTGHEVFDPTIYYFQKIPTIVEPLTIAWIIGGALLIAVLASILPALRAARLHPVEALRYE